MQNFGLRHNDSDDFDFSYPLHGPSIDPIVLCGLLAAGAAALVSAIWLLT